MCAVPYLCALPNLVLKGPINAPPQSGWRLMTLPAQAGHLTGAWNQYPTNPVDAKAAWGDMLSFLASNGITSSAVSKEVIAIGEDQWCSPEPWRCKGVRKSKPMPYLPWAKSAWEDANNKLADGTVSPGVKLTTIVTILTRLINGPEGCKYCAKHWTQVLKANPPPANPTLDEARRWLVDRHNETRERKTPTPFETVAAKFNWTTA